MKKIVSEQKGEEEMGNERRVSGVQIMRAKAEERVFIGVQEVARFS